MLTFAQVTRVPSAAEAKQFVIDLLVGAGFKTAASWQDGTLARTTAIEIPAAVKAEVAESIATIARGMYNDTAEGDWLTLYSLSAYDNLRKEPTRARGVAILTASSAAPPYTVAVDYLVASDATGKTFRNKTGGVLAPGGTLALEWEAEQAGSAANSVQPGALSHLQTTLAGVTVSNPGSGGVWLTRLGTDEEATKALRVRNKTKWATRAMHAPEDAYANWALQAAVEVTRAEVDSQNPEGPGSLRIYVAGAQGAVPPELEQIVLDYIIGNGPDGIVRRAVGAEVFVSAAVNRFVTIEGTVYVAAAYAASAQSNVDASLSEFEQAHPIGGTRIDPTEPGKLLRASLYGLIMRVPGVMNVDLQTPSGDIDLLQSEVVIFDVQLVYVIV